MARRKTAEAHFRPFVAPGTLEAGAASWVEGLSFLLLSWNNTRIRRCAKGASAVVSVVGSSISINENARTDTHTQGSRLTPEEVLLC